jgi:hypothetical protein
MMERSMTISPVSSWFFCLRCLFIDFFRRLWIAPDRSGKISKFNADGFAVLEANAAQITQNKILEAKLAATRPALAKNASERSWLFFLFLL